MAVQWGPGAAGNLISAAAGIRAVQTWNALGHRGPTFESFGQGTLTINVYSNAQSPVLGSASAVCRDGGWTAVTVAINAGAIATTSDAGNAAYWTGAHEFGHALGLAHPPPGAGPIGTCPGTVMWYSVDVWFVCGQNSPSPLDRDAVNALYD